MANPSEGAASWGDNNFESLEIPMSALSADELNAALPSYSFDTPQLSYDEIIRVEVAIDQLHDVDRQLLSARFGLSHPELGGDIERLAEAFGLTTAEVRQRLLTAWRATAKAPPPNGLLL